jgi:hypothetical protein
VVEVGVGVEVEVAVGVGVGVGVDDKQYWNCPEVHTYVNPKSLHVLVVDRVEV